MTNNVEKESLMTVAVLGASGGIGRQLIHQALGRGHRVIALVRDHVIAVIMIGASAAALLLTLTDRRLRTPTRPANQPA